MSSVKNIIDNNDSIDRTAALKLLNTEIFSDDYYYILNKANAYSRNTFNNKGIVFAQIGVDAAPCSVNCRFCQLGCDNFKSSNTRTMSCSDVVKQANSLVQDGANEIFLMTTGDIDKDLFLEIGKNVRCAIPKEMRMVANTADFDQSYANKLADVGFTGVYHICRLGEGEDTEALVEDRIKTLDAVKNSKLELYYCVEPIGPEHTDEQIADEIFRAKDYQIDVMAVMRRVNFENSPMTENGELSAAQLALICAVSVLCVKPQRAMGVHEPEIISLISGANQIYAEIGTNPRDTLQNTEQSRGVSVQKAKTMLNDAQWEI